jgi:hypothetical protein
VVWSSEAGSEFRVRASLRTAGGGFGSPELVLDVGYVGATGVTVSDLDAAMSPTGSVDAVWTDVVTNAASDHSITLRASRRSPGAGGSWISPKKLDDAAWNPGTPGGTDIDTPHVAALAGGGSVVAWQTGEVAGNSPSYALSAQRTAAGTTYVPLSTMGTASDPSDSIRHVGVAPLAADGALAVWNSGNAVVKGSLRPAGGPFGPSAPLPLDAPKIPSVNDVQLAGNGIGDAAAVTVRMGAYLILDRYDGTPPRLDGFSAPASLTPGQSGQFTVDATDALTSATSPVWDFGDGTTAAGASVGHAYAAPGTYKVAVSSTDSVGNVGTRAATVVVAAPPPLVPAGTTGADAPRITAFSITPRAFSVSSRAARRGAGRRNAAFLYTLSAPARVTISLRRALPGVKVGKRCAAPPRRRVGHPRRCVRYVAAGSLSRAGRTGANRLAFTGRIGRRALRRGTYRATIVARDSAGRRSAARSLLFRVR